MTEADALIPYVRAWVAARSRGQDPSAADLCRDRPELVPSLEKRLADLRGTPSGPDPLGTLGSGHNLPPLPGQPEPDDATAYPDRVGDYHLMSILGRGGMGAVFRAEDLRLGRQVAVKLILPEQAGNPTARARFLREARAQAGVENDHVLPIYQAGEQNGILYIAMPLLQGETLRDLLQREPIPPLPVTLKIAREVADGLAAAHAKGVIHRDIKPGNIWLEGDLNAADPADRFRRCRVLDFGLARHVEAPQNRVTMNRELLGTPAYMSPEQAGGGEIDARSDLFSLGVLLYEMTTGVQPFDDASPINSLVKLASYTPPPSGEVNPALPGELTDLITRMMSRVPAKRPASAREVLTALRKLDPNFSVVMTTSSLPAVSRPPLEGPPSQKSPQAEIKRNSLTPVGQKRFEDEHPSEPETRAWKDHKPQPGGRNLGLSIGLGVAAVVLLAVGVGVVATQTDLFKKSTPVEKSTEPDTNKQTAVAPVEVRVRVRPTDAILRPTSESSVPVTPGLAAGEYRVLLKPDQRLTVRVVREGYKPLELDLDATKTEVEVGLQPRLPETLRVAFSGLPAGAVVKFLDDPAAKADGAEYLAKYGPQRVEITAAGYEKYSTTVEPVAGLDRVTVPVSLKPAAPPKAYTDGSDIELVLIPPGDSTLGFANPPEKQYPDQPARRVTITRPYYLGKYEVTRGQFQKFLEETDHKLETEVGNGGFGYVPEAKQYFEQSPKFDWKNVGFKTADNQPVVNVSWNDARAFCEWMSKKEKRRYRLPTEAEWEHAARAGATTRYFFGDGDADLVKYANVADLSARAQFDEDNPGRTLKGFEGDDGVAFLAPVGKYKPNPHGLHDVYGNVWELCDDCYGSVLLLPKIDPRQTTENAQGTRVARGGSFDSGTPGVVLARLSVAKEQTHVVLGFRVLVELP